MAREQNTRSVRVEFDAKNSQKMCCNRQNVTRDSNKKQLSRSRQTDPRLFLYVDTPARARATHATRVTHRSSDAGGARVVDTTVGVVERTTRDVDDIRCATKCIIVSIGGETPTDDATRRDDRWGSDDDERVAVRAGCRTNLAVLRPGETIGRNDGAAHAERGRAGGRARRSGGRGVSARTRRDAGGNRV